MAPILAKTCAAAFPTSSCGKTKAVVVASFTKFRLAAGKATHLCLSSRSRAKSFAAKPFFNNSPASCRATTGFSALANSWAKAEKYCSTFACSACLIWASAWAFFLGSWVAKSNSVKLIAKNEHPFTSLPGRVARQNHPVSVVYMADVVLDLCLSWCKMLEEKYVFLWKEMEPWKMTSLTVRMFTCSWFPSTSTVLSANRLQNWCSKTNQHKTLCGDYPEYILCTA